MHDRNIFSPCTKTCKDKACQSSPVLSPLPLLHIVYKWLPSRVQFNSAHFRISAVAITARPFSLQEFIKLEVQKFIWVLKLATALTQKKGEKQLKNIGKNSEGQKDWWRDSGQQTDISKKERKRDRKKKRKEKGKWKNKSAFLLQYYKPSDCSNYT